MTTTVAKVVQWCFTTCMAAITSPKSSKPAKRESIYEKAQRMLAEPHRVTVIKAHGDDFWVGIITGDHDRYPVFAISEEFMVANNIDTGGGRLGCLCPRGFRRQLCSHMIMGEELRKRGKVPAS